MAEISLRGKAPAAPLRNVQLLLETIQTLRDRPAHLPRMGVMHGPSGYGKSMAAAVAAIEHDCVYIECADSWTKRAVIEALTDELGLEMAPFHYKTMDAIAGELAASRRVLLIDEADFLAAKGLLELAREIHMKSGQPVVLFGEEGFPQKVKRYERIHSRVGKWTAALSADLSDVRQLAAMYVTDVKIADDLLAYLLVQMKGQTRRIVTNLETIRTAAIRDDIEAANMAWWGGRPFEDGEAPNKRKL